MGINCCNKLLLFIYFGSPSLFWHRAKYVMTIHGKLANQVIAEGKRGTVSFSIVNQVLVTLLPVGSFPSCGIQLSQFSTAFVFSLSTSRSHSHSLCLNQSHSVSLSLPSHVSFPQ